MLLLAVFWLLVLLQINRMWWIEFRQSSSNLQVNEDETVGKE